MSTPSARTNKSNAVVLKVGMVGDAGIGKSSLMVKYVEGSYDEDYIQTLGVNFMEKTVTVRKTNITFSIWDMGGKAEFISMLPLVVSEASVILFMFDLTRPATLNSVKGWFKQARQLNKKALPFLVGTKFDLFMKGEADYHAEVCKLARKFAQSMKAPLIFCSSSIPLNVKKIFKLVLARTFDMKPSMAEIHTVGHPLIEFSTWKLHGDPTDKKEKGEKEAAPNKA